MLFAPEIERTADRNNNKNQKKKQKAKSLDLEDPYVSKQRTMTEVNNYNNNKGDNNDVSPCHNSPKCLSHLARMQMNIQ